MDALNHLDQLDELIFSLSQADALLTVATLVDFTDLTPTTAFNYLCAMNNIVSNAKSICEKLILVS